MILWMNKHSLSHAWQTQICQLLKLDTSVKDSSYRHQVWNLQSQVTIHSWTGLQVLSQRWWGSCRDFSDIFIWHAVLANLQINLSQFDGQDILLSYFVQVLTLPLDSDWRNSTTILCQLVQRYGILDENQEFAKCNSLAVSLEDQIPNFKYAKITKLVTYKTITIRNTNSYYWWTIHWTIQLVEMVIIKIS